MTTGNSMTKTATARKADRLNLRINAEQKQLLEAAARLRHKSISSFVLDQAFEAAEDVLAEQTHFNLDPQQWKAFCRALDRPPRILPGLRKLLRTPTPVGQR